MFMAADSKLKTLCNLRVFRGSYLSESCIRIVFALETAEVSRLA